MASTVDNLGVSPVPPSPADVLSQVNNDVAKVNQAYSDGMSAVSSNILGLGGNADAAAALQGLQPNIQQWISDGTNAANNGTKPPGLNGWIGWQNAGNQFISGINTITQIGSTATMDNIIATAQGIASDIEAVPKKVAKVIGASAGQAAVTAVESSVVSAVNTAETKTLVVVGVLIAGYVILHGLKVLR